MELYLHNLNVSLWYGAKSRKITFGICLHILFQLKLFWKPYCKHNYESHLFIYVKLSNSFMSMVIMKDPHFMK